MTAAKTQRLIAICQLLAACGALACDERPLPHNTAIPNFERRALVSRENVRDLLRCSIA